MKTVNLQSLINARNDLTDDTYKAYLSRLGVSIKPSEMVDLVSLVEKMKLSTPAHQVYNSYYVGFEINQIGKEFDLLRIGKGTVINIELKRENTGERIKKQLIKNKYYLQILEKEIFSFTYVSENETLYYLDDDEVLTEVDIEFLLDTINDQEIQIIDDIHSLFDPTNYLVSPFNSTERFLENEYFLTNHQEHIKNDLLRKLNNSNNKFFSLEGAAGTGKTLLVYDLAKSLKENGKRVAIIHCGYLNTGQNKLISNHSWKIFQIKDYRNALNEDYDLIIIDEVQRIYKNQFNNIIEYINEHPIECIFAYDPNQTLHSKEIRNKIPEHIESISSSHYKLSDKIRTNAELGAFIKNLFDLSKRNPNQVYSNIDLQYFSDSESARTYINFLKTDGWVSIDYTVSQFNRCSLGSLNTYTGENAHSVIGQEFDKVIIVIGYSFFYNENGFLMGDRRSYYHPTKMLLQMITRVRKKLCVVIVNNEPVLQKCLEIINN